jgi:peptidoglycan/LPS O-acetylase OafA/YrhL
VSLRHRADIDGLRAVAVLPVALFHAHFAFASGGFVGVDVFFVISGFLICSLIAEELAQGEFSILRFYERRCRRILPALFAMFVGTSALGALWLMPPDLVGFGRSLLSSVLFVSNIYFWKDSGYFDGAAEFKPLLHTWSLSVEEQFYLVVPYLLLGISVFFRKRYLTILLPVALGSLALSNWAVSHAPNAAFYLLPTRFWEILMGGLLAVSGVSGPADRRLRQALAALGLAGILGAIAYYSEETRFPGLKALLPCAGAALVLYAGMGPAAAAGSRAPAPRDATLVSRLLGSRPLAFVGKISYSLYLWHWPLFALYRYRLARELTLLESLVILGLSFALATASWHFVEKPFRHAASGLDRRLIFRAAAAGALVMASFAGTAMATGGLPSRTPGFERIVPPGQNEYDSGGAGACFLDDNQTFADWGGERCFVTRGRGPNVLLWGDSFAAHYVPGIKHQAAHVHADILQYTLSACPPVFSFDTLSNPACRAFNDHVLEVIAAYQVRGVVISSRWDYAFRRHVEPSQIAETVARLQQLGVAVRLCRLPSCPYRQAGLFMMCDEGHFSARGSEIAVASYFPYFDGR